MDVISAIHRIRVKDSDEWKTAFNTRFGLYEWLVISFELTDAPTTFQRYINWVLCDELDICCSAYIDDVVIYNDTQKEHRFAVLRIIRKLADAGLQLDFDKSEFEGGIIKYLGYLIETGRGLQADPEKLEAIRKWELPTKVRGVRGFLGFCNYYHQFIDEYSRIAEPLTQGCKDIGCPGRRTSRTSDVLPKVVTSYDIRTSSTLPRGKSPTVKRMDEFCTLGVANGRSDRWKSAHPSASPSA